MKIALALFLLLVVAGGTFYLWTLLDKNNKQILAGAQKCYEQGENFFNQKNYKAALLSYEEVTEFYSRPRTQWADLAEEKQWICRAYLNDWTSAKGKWNGDLREIKPHDYEKYKAELIVITPVAVVEGAGNTMAPAALIPTPVLTMANESSAPTASFTAAPTASSQTPVFTATAVEPTKTPSVTTAPVDPNQTPTFTATPADLTPTPSPAI
jgi:hypothetical protein